jgi:CubicO group peptidase (beta-lactamase class C family)
LSDQSRSLPSRPNLRYLKLEAKRRLAAGEFATLHDAQLAIAREHGQPSWAVLKELISAQPSQASHALTQVRWVLSRYQGAGTPGWAAPGDSELRDHFDDHFLSMVPPDTLASTLATVAERLGEELVVTREAPQGISARIADMQLEAAAEPGPPHRLTGLRMYPVGRRATDARVAAPSTRMSGAVPAAAAKVAAESFSELGVAGLTLAGVPEGTAGDHRPVWTAARGWADLDRAEVLREDHRFPAYSVTKLITATAVLRLAADGRIGLDDPANEHLRTIRLADGAVTIRELLSHTGGVDSPSELFAGSVPDLRTLIGPVAGCGGPRGTFAYSNGGYAMLGQLVADVTGSPYQEAATRMVLRPLGMTSSSFPASWPGTGAITGYQLAGDGSFEPAPAEICTMPAAGGLWATGADLVRFGLAWASLLPDELAREALRPHAARDSTGAHVGLGWLLNEPTDLCGHAGDGTGAATSLIIRLSTGQPSVAMTNRLVPIEPVNVRLLGPIA